MHPAPLPSDPSPPAPPAAASARRRLYRIILTVVTAGIGLGLKLSQKPWEGSGARRLAKGRELKFDELVQIQLWWAAAIICGLLVLALATSPWWMKWSRAGETTPAPAVLPPSPSAPWTRTHRWLLAGVLLLALCVRLPRMNRFIERDEQDTARLGIIGYVPLDPSGQPSGQPVVHPWKMTVWECSMANNPFLFSIAARGTVRAWQAVTGAEPWRVEVAALRLPSLIAGLLALTVLVRLGWMAGYPGVGLLAALLGAVHPMQVEFSTQARGYGMVMLFAPLALACAWQGLRRGRWRDWLATGGCLLGLLWANPGSIYFAASLGVCLTGWLLGRLRRDPSGATRTALTRWFLGAGLAALVYLPLILPAMAHAAPYLKNMKGALDGYWMVMSWAHFGAGLCYPAKEMTDVWVGSGGGFGGWLQSRYFQTEPFTACFIVFCAPVLLWLGLRWWWDRWDFRPLLVAATAAPLVAFLIHLGPDTPFIFHWYLIYALPPFLLFTAAGLTVPGQKCAALTGIPAMAALPALAWLGAIIFINQPGLGRISWTAPVLNEPAVYLRGRYQWITGSDGITYRQLIPGRSEKKEGDR